MKWKTIFRVILILVILSVLMFLLNQTVIEPWLKKKIQTVLNEKIKDYNFEIRKASFHLFSLGLTLEEIAISKKEADTSKSLNIKISAIEVKGINFIKAIFKKDIYIEGITVPHIYITGVNPFSTKEKKKPPSIFKFNLNIIKFSFDTINLKINNTSFSKLILLKNSYFHSYNFQIKKGDTISMGIIGQIDFGFNEIMLVPSDSMYTVQASETNYNHLTSKLSINGISLQPNYNNYDFTGRYNYETDRIEAVFSNIDIYNIPVSQYFNANNITSSHMEIGAMDVSVFRDKRKMFKHTYKPALQDLVRNLPFSLNIDSISLKNGNVNYTEHAEQANEPGRVDFKEIRAGIFNITNDSVNMKDAVLRLKATGLLMGKGKMSVLLDARLFDKHNTFTMKGSLSELNIEELNPMLEKNAFVFATSGILDTMNFQFTANDFKSQGNLTMVYTGLRLKLKNKTTDDTTGLKANIMSFFANRKVMDSNPLPGDKIRIGIIDYDRNPEKFIFNYCFKSILSGIQSSLNKKPEK